MAMLFEKFMDLLPYFGFQPKPFPSLQAFKQVLPEGMSFAVIDGKGVSWHVAASHEKELEESLTTEGGFVAAPEEFAGFSHYRLVLSYDDYEDLNWLAGFLLSGLVGGFWILGRGQAFNPLLLKIGASESPWTESDLADLRAAHDKAPNDALLNNLLGKVCDELGDPSASAGYFADAAKAVPHFAEPYSNLGALMWRTDQKERAFDLFCEALLRQPFNVDIQDNFIRTGLEANKHAAMKECLDKVEKFFPEYATLLYLKAVLTLNLGNRDGCRNILEDLLRREPEDERARQLLSELN